MVKREEIGVRNSGVLPESMIAPQGLQVVIGAGKPLGRAVIQRIGDGSGAVRAVVLDKISEPNFPDSVEMVRADPVRTGDLTEACKGASVIYDCFEPNQAVWKRATAEVTANALLAAIDTGATLVVASHLSGEEGENARVENEVLAAHGGGLSRTVITRMPQTYGPGVVNPLWRDIFESVLKGKKAHWMGNPEVPRSFLYIGDAADAMILLSRSVWSHGRAWNIAGPGPLTGREFIEHAYAAEGKRAKVGTWGRGIMLTGGVFASDARKFLDIPYEYYRPFVLDGSDFATGFPNSRFTPHDVAMAETLEWFRSDVGLNR